MIKYIIKRILIFIPTLIAISLITFYISVHAPGDPVDMMLGKTGGENIQSADKLTAQKTYMELRHKLGLDLPLFYFSFGSLAYPDTIYRIPDRNMQDNLERLVNRYGNWPQVQDYYLKIRSTNALLKYVGQDSTSADDIISSRNYLYDLSLHDDPATIKYALTGLNAIVNKDKNFRPVNKQIAALDTVYNAMTTKTTTWKNYIPTLHYYGFRNQYHHWLVKFIRGDFGISYHDGQPVADVLWSAVKWTLLISILSIIITYVIAVPVGVSSAINKNSLRDQASSTFLFMLYSLPSFWIATLLIIFLGGGDYLHIFPAYGLSDLDSSAPFLQRALDLLYHLVLPLICWTYPSFAFLSRQMRSGMLNVINQDFIRTAKAKGLDDKHVYWKHAFRNSLLPLITLFANVFPFVISGAVVLEYIFSIPGMGKLTYDAIAERNYPVVYAVTMFSAILTLIGYLLADILYAVVDPRITFTKKNNS